jgi:hypothetical protein
MKSNQASLQGYTQRDREISDYNRQQSDWNNYLDKQRKSDREAALYGLAGSAVSSGISAGLYKWARA